MTAKNSSEALCPANIWEDIVEDLLEVAGRLNCEERKILLAALRREGTGENEVEAYLSFAIGTRIVALGERSRIQECWFYHPPSKTIQKFKLT